MIVPARRTSRARRDLRRSHHALSDPPRANCPQCGEPRARTASAGTAAPIAAAP